jgi:hypothetical protein
MATLVIEPAQTTRIGFWRQPLRSGTTIKINELDVLQAAPCFALPVA